MTFDELLVAIGVACFGLSWGIHADADYVAGFLLDAAGLLFCLAGMP